MAIDSLKQENQLTEKLFKAGMHFAYSKSRRHPSVAPFIFGTKNRVEVFNLAATSEFLSRAKAFIENLGKNRKTILFVGGKQEGKQAVKHFAEKINMPNVSGRYIGGTLTNFTQIRKRVDKLEKLLDEKEKGELGRYTKMERLLIDRDIERLEKDFGGIRRLKDLPAAVVLIDPKKEVNAVKEAKILNIPIVALLNSDCNLGEVDFPVPGNDSLKSSITAFLAEIAEAYEEGLKMESIEAVKIV